MAAGMYSLRTSTAASGRFHRTASSPPLQEEGRYGALGPTAVPRPARRSCRLESLSIAPAALRLSIYRLSMAIRVASAEYPRTASSPPLPAMALTVFQETAD